ncbi:hypothetical protein A2U01_0097784, partial [Trifolium medium]|nr:hypothetical protein [Trifolium medium]
MGESSEATSSYSFFQGRMAPK